MTTPDKTYRVMIDYKEFRNMLVEGDNAPWGDKYFSATFDKYVEDDAIEIEYKYGVYDNGKSTIKWRIPDTEKVYAVRYTSSSRFAFWWCGYTDDIENEGDYDD